MADEITITVQLKAVKGGSTVLWQEQNLSFDWTGNNHVRNRQTIGITEEAVYLGDTLGKGFMMCKNHDSTNYVQLLAGSGGSAYALLLPGEVALFRLDTAVAPWAIANTAPCEVEFLILEL